MGGVRTALEGELPDEYDSEPKQAKSAKAVPAPVFQSLELAVPFDSFARSLGPQAETRIYVVNGRRIEKQVPTQPGSDDEVWLTLLRMRHGPERHTLPEWQGLIEKYRTEPAHPAHPDFGKGA